MLPVWVRDSPPSVDGSRRCDTSSSREGEREKERRESCAGEEMIFPSLLFTPCVPLSFHLLHPCLSCLRHSYPHSLAPSSVSSASSVAVLRSDRSFASRFPSLASIRVCLLPVSRCLADDDDTSFAHSCPSCDLSCSKGHCSCLTSNYTS